MYIDDDEIEVAALLIDDALSFGLPYQEEAEWRGWSQDGAQALQTLVEELSWSDLCVALRLAASRLAAEVDPPDASTNSSAATTRRRAEGRKQ